MLTNAVTLEHELFLAENADTLRAAFLTLHPRSADRWTNEIEQAAEAGRGNAFVKLLSETRTRKGDFAQQLAAQIEAGAPFIVPDYIRDAIEAVAAP